jgi:hypothetical protein
MTKIIANRLKKILPRIISENHGGFVKKRQILDNIIMVQEVIHSSTLQGDKGMIIKIDMANIFDQIHHSFLFDVLHKFGIYATFIRWISSCICNPWITPLLNGRPSKLFKYGRGIQQGFLLSPVLYIIVDEALSRKIEAERGSGSLPEIRVVWG